MVTAIDFFAILTLVGKQSCLLFLPYRGNVNVIGRMKTHGLRAKIDLVIEQLEAASTSKPGSKG